MPASIPEEGQLVLVRRRAFAVRTVKPSGLPPGAAGSPVPQRQHLVSLSSVEDDGLGEELEVVWEIEPGATVLERASLPEPKAFDDPNTLDAFLDAVRWGAISSADDRALQSPFRSGIEIDEYQLDPVVRALSMPRVNLLIADDVGLGKTIEAGLVVQELILRHRARSIIVVCPSSLQIQWRDEMRDKFGLEFRIVDSEALSQLRRRRGIRVNPWTHFPRLITSIDFLKREHPMRLFRETLPANGESTYPRRYDLLILDECHNAAPPGRTHYAIDSLRTMAIRSLAPHFEHKLFLTATPHNGYRESFSALLELLDNQRFARGVKQIDRNQLEAVMIRRMKSELKKRWDGSRRFADRVVQHLEVDYSAAEKQAHQDLKAYSETRLAQAGDNAARMAAEFVLKLLKKRLFSSPAAFETTLRKHRQTIGAALPGGVSEFWLRRQIDEAEEDHADDAEHESSAEEALENAGSLLDPVKPQEKKLLDRLTVFAATAAERPDSKARRLLAWLEEFIRPGGRWTDERVIIFTEYRTTQKWLHGMLAAAGFAADDRLLMIYGGMPMDERERVKAAFQAHPRDAKVRILLATDAASEGLNLQNHCSRLIHYEIPWNPNRMEQRNGRVDRHGQKAAEVRIHHFVAAGFDAAKPAAEVGDLEADLEFLMRAALKVETIREDLGKVGPVIAAQVEEAMLGKRKALDTAKAEQENEPVRRMLKFERQLRDQLEKLAAKLNDTRRELRLDPENILNVVRVGLTVAGQPQLVPAQLPGVWPDPEGKRKSCPVFQLPALSGSWAECATGLSHPHTRAIRPITFDPAVAAGRDDVVLVHLNHRLVQMCLRLLRAEVWSHGQTRRLNRVCTRMVPDTALQAPALIAHGRIVVLGGDSQRLHEELIMAGGIIREGRFSRLNVTDTRAAWEASLSESAPGFVEDRLVELWPKHQASVLASLEARMTERTKNLESFLTDRADKEVARMTAVMNELMRAIREELEVGPEDQLEFGWSLEERDQRNRDLGNLRRRLSEIPAEIENETRHLRRRFENPSARLFPVAITYLVPRRAAAELQGERK